MKWAFWHIHEYYSPSEYFHFKIFIYKKYLENENDNFQENLLWPGINDAWARYQVTARRFRNTVLYSSVIIINL